MHESNTLLAITFSIAVYVAFIWFFGNRFLRNIIAQSMLPAIGLFLIFPFFAVISLGFIKIFDLSIDIEIVFVVLTILFFYFLEFRLGILSRWFGEISEEIKLKSSPAAFFLRDKKPCEILDNFIKAFNAEINSFGSQSLLLCGFNIFFLSNMWDIYPLKSFDSLKWSFQISASNFQQYLIYGLVFLFSIYIFHFSHRVRLKIIFNDCIFLIRVAENHGNFLLLKGRGEIVECAYSDCKIDSIASMSPKSPIFYTFNDRLCVLLDSRIEFVDFKASMRIIEEEGVEGFASRIGISLSSSDLD
jgi:hypothetical protein